MCSQTALGRDAFAAYWDLTTLGCLARSRPSWFPSGEELRHFVDPRRDEHDRLLSLFVTHMGLDPVVVQIARDGAPWATGESSETTEAMLSLRAGRILTSDDLRANTLDDVLEVASKRTVAWFVDAWIGGHYCFGDRMIDPANALEEALDVLARIVDEDSLPGHHVKLGLVQWVRDELPPILAGRGIEPFIAWLRTTSLG